MKAIILSETQFDQLFQATLDKLEKLRYTRGIMLDEKSQFDNSPIGEMHRTFVYELVELRRKLREAQ